MNVPPPWSLLFYPVIAYVVEVIFHAVPLALLLATLGPLFRKLNRTSLVWVCIVLASVLEPMFQLRAGLAAKHLSWLEVYVGLHVFAFNVVQMYVFRRYDFVSLYSLPLFYYLHWHIIWGYLRLQGLF